MQGEWQGRLAEKMGLSGAVSAEDFARLTEGRHPQTDEQMVKHRTAQEYTNANGTTTSAVEHRAGWDATFSAPKSVSLTALVGGDERVLRRPIEPLSPALLVSLERYTHARIGGNNAAETTGNFIVAKFGAISMHCPSRRRLRRSSASHPRGRLQCDGASRRINPEPFSRKVSLIPKTTRQRFISLY